ncbi:MULTISPECIES: NEAT domain-containing protein [Terrisporobacter]|uniref:NEAT domain-containing protein n=1 Tax=Terrisporobacter muris TaxID=2963284 RepID=A0A9X2S3X4_9FIRM|nr:MULTISPECIES: NEAT domain-containing protein [Terrisporobacter]MCR1822811.1 NEAT domain-containing protein [Terrisporobacter muris]MDU6983765.1 NEAT domain-containing protein [Terrisporobacter othiniensis]MDY3372414.1 NEAT domain-containing protein [Terrisporobacter othiniensis]
MIRKGKLVKNTAIALAIMSVFGSTLTPVSAAEIMKSSTAITQYVEGTYDINAKLIKDTSDEDSMANGYLESTKIQISNNKIYMIMKFTSGSLLKELNPSVNGEAVKGNITTDSSDDTKTVKFEINSLNDNITLGVKINPFGSFVVDAECRIKVEKAEIPTQPTTPEEDDAVTSPTPSVPDEDENDKEEVKENEKTLNTVLKHETEDKDSSANRYLESSKLKVVDNKKYMVINFNSGNMFTAMKASVNGKEVETKFEYDKKSDIATVEFEISSLEDEMLLTFTYNTPIGSMTHSARIQSKIEESGNEGEVTPPSDNEDDNTGLGDSNNDSGSDSNSGNGSSNGSGSNSGSSNSNSTYKNGYYQLKNIVHSDNAVGYQMVRSLLSETTNMEVKNGKTYITLRMSSYSLMGDISMKVNNKTVKFTKNVIDNDTVEFSLEVPNLNAKITMNMFVTAMNQTVSFGVSFDKSTVKFISSNEEPTIPNTNGGSINNGGNNNSSSNNNSTSGSNDIVAENTTVKGKLYTIKNEIISDSATGKEMARKYLNSTTKIEEINGKMYATLTFTGVDLMSNHKIYVNGSLVNYTVTSSSSSSKSIRFAIPNVNADIKVQVHVIPMNSTVTFGVKLLEDTLTFVKDFEVQNGKLPQTGSAFGSEMILGFGGLLTASGVLLRKKRK